MSICSAKQVDSKFTSTSQVVGVNYNSTDTITMHSNFRIIIFKCSKYAILRNCEYCDLAWLILLCYEIIVIRAKN